MRTTAARGPIFLAFPPALADNDRQILEVAMGGEKLLSRNLTEFFRELVQSAMTSQAVRSTDRRSLIETEKILDRG